MKSWKVSIEQLRLDPATYELLDVLQKGFQHFGIDYYLVGAISRNAWMNGLHRIVPRRTTTDIDFAVLINDKGRFEELMSHLIKNENFVGSKENAFVLIWKNGYQVDLLPFGAIEDEDRKVSIIGTGFTSVDVPGFLEIYEGELPEIDINNHRLKCCSLPGIVLLKLIAWDDRPELRSGDIIDIADILKYFFDMYTDEIYENHHDLFQYDEMELIDIAAIVLGREIKKIACRNKELENRLLHILNGNTESYATSRIAILMTSYFDNTAEDNYKLLIRIKHGYIGSRA